MPFSHPPYMPGINQRPDDALFAPYKKDLHRGAPPESLAAGAAFKGGLAAYHAGYFWEAHELWEAVWHCLPEPSPERHLLRALIQLANAALKTRMGRGKAAARILPLAIAAMGDAFGRGDSGDSGRDAVMGFTRATLEDMAEAIKAKNMQNNA